MQLPQAARIYFGEAGAASRFTFQYFRELVRPRYEVRQFVRQCYLIGYISLPLIAITGLIMGSMKVTEQIDAMEVSDTNSLNAW